MFWDTTILEKLRFFRADCLLYNFWDPTPGLKPPRFGQGYASYELVGCAQLGRLAVGGYFVLRCDFVTWLSHGENVKVINLVLATRLDVAMREHGKSVAPSLRRKGIGRELVTELLHRLPGESSDPFRAWAVVDVQNEAALETSPLVAVALTLSQGALFRDVVVYQLTGRGDCSEYLCEGRLRQA
eukprot:s1707_g9.t1